MTLRYTRYRTPPRTLAATTVCEHALALVGAHQAAIVGALQAGTVSAHQAAIVGAHQAATVSAHQAATVSTHQAGTVRAHGIKLVGPPAMARDDAPAVAANVNQYSHLLCMSVAALTSHQPAHTPSEQ